MTKKKKGQDKQWYAKLYTENYNLCARTLLKTWCDLRCYGRI